MYLDSGGEEGRDQGKEETILEPAQGPSTLGPSVVKFPFPGIENPRGYSSIPRYEERPFDFFEREARKTSGNRMLSCRVRLNIF